MTEGQQNVFHALQREGEDDEEFEEEPKGEGIDRVRTFKFSIRIIAFGARRMPLGCLSGASARGAVTLSLLLSRPHE